MNGVTVGAKTLSINDVGWRDNGVDSILHGVIEDYERRLTAVLKITVIQGDFRL